MDIVERLRELSTKERRKHKSAPDLAMFDGADEIERLRQQVEDLHDLMQRQIFVNSYLRQQNAELVNALHRISLGSQNSMTSKEGLGVEARRAIAKATGGE